MKLNDRHAAEILPALIYLTNKDLNPDELLKKGIITADGKLANTIRPLLGQAQQELDARGNYFQCSNSGMRFLLDYFPQGPEDLTNITEIVANLVFLIMRNTRKGRSWLPADINAFTEAEREISQFVTIDDRASGPAQQSAAQQRGEKLDFKLVAIILLTVLENLGTQGNEQHDDAQGVEALRQELVEIIESYEEKQESSDKNDHR